jgi:hypothetical protein
VRVVINHLTRMRSPYVCVAGVDNSGRHIRPVLSVGQLDRDLLRSKGGAFSLGANVDLGPTDPRPTVPELEDVVFDPGRTKVVDYLDPAAFGGVLEEIAVDSLGAIFGAEFVRMSGTAAAVPLGTGSASLGVLRLEGAELDAREHFGKHEIRLRFTDPDLGELSIKVTDLRLWESDQETPSMNNIQSIRNRLDGCRVAVGLTRAFAVSSYEGVWHWLQINNVFPEDDPLWVRE